MRRLIATLAFVFAAPLLVAALAAQGAQPPPATPTPTKGSGIKKFTITLVLGDTQPGASSGLSAEATKALADLKDFLPYKQYRVMDTLPIIGLGGPWAPMQGPYGKYSFYMRAMDISPRLTQVEMLRLCVANDKGVSIGACPIDTNFKIETGETVVVGTSRLEGTQALILLVTAVP